VTSALSAIRGATPYPFCAGESGPGDDGMTCASTTRLKLTDPPLAVNASVNRGGRSLRSGGTVAVAPLLLASAGRFSVAAPRSVYNRAMQQKEVRLTSLATCAG